MTDTIIQELAEHPELLYRHTVIVNLLDRVVEVYREPVPGEGRFNEIANPFKGDSLAFPTAAGEAVVVPMRQLLP